MLDAAANAVNWGGHSMNQVPFEPRPRTAAGILNCGGAT
jgi:hypothetical protein